MNDYRKVFFHLAKIRYPRQARYAGDMKKEKLVKALSKMIPNFVTDLTSDAADTFLVSDPSKPKVLLFSDKEKIPTILKALSSDSVFKRSIKFAFVKKSEDAVVKKLKIKKFPTFFMVRGAKSEIREESTMLKYCKCVPIVFRRLRNAF